MEPSQPDILEYLDFRGRSIFAPWFAALPAGAAARVAIAVTRLEMGHRSNVKAVGEGVSEYRLDFGPGYRIYFGQDGPQLIILLCGGTKKRQQADIEAAKANWADYRARKKEGGR
jgi:putative addiction module killer protein